VGVENRKVGDGFACRARINDATAKWTLPLDLARQIGLSTMSKGKLIVVGE
jgi:hypothetical protein